MVVTGSRSVGGGAGGDGLGAGEVEGAAGATVVGGIDVVEAAVGGGAGGNAAWAYTASGSALPAGRPATTASATADAARTITATAAVSVTPRRCTRLTLDRLASGSARHPPGDGATGWRAGAPDT